LVEYVEVHSTTNTRDEADRICSAVVQARLAASAQVLAPIRSTYWWQGRIERTDEYLLSMKTTRDKFDQLGRMIRANHSYEIPEIVAVSIIDGSDDFLGWISAETREPGESA